MAEQAPASRLKRIEFGEWTPDAPKTGAGLQTAKGVLSKGGRYTAKPALARYDDNARVTSGTVIGAFSCYTGLGGASQQHLFLAEARAIYRLVNRVPANLSRASGYATADAEWVWCFEQLGDNILAGARGVPLQKFRWGEDATFADVPDAGQVAGADTYAPRTVDAIGRIGPHVLVGFGRTLRWSAYNDCTWWTPDAARQSGETEMPAAGGGFVKIRGGESGAIFQERMISRIAYVGGSTVFQKDEVETQRGAMSPHGVIPFGPNTFYVSEEGFFLFDGLRSQNVGEGKVNKFFLDRLNYAYRHRISASLDLSKRAVIIAYPANGSTTPNEQLIWSYADNRWSWDDEALMLAWEMGREGTSLDDSAALIALFGTAAIDSISASLDSPLMRESRKQWAAVDTSGYLSLYTGDNRPAQITTAEAEIGAGRNTWITRSVPIIDAPRGVAVSLAYRRHNLGRGQGTVGTTRTNLLTYASDASNAAWFKVRSTGGGSGTTDHLGGTTASTLIDDGTATNTHLMRQTPTFVSGTTYTFSAIVKGAGRGARLQLSVTSFSSTPTANFDLTLGVVDAFSGTSNAGIRHLGNDWYLIWITAAATASSTSNAIVQLYDEATDSPTYSGDSASGIVFAGAQVEASTMPTELIPTYATSASLTGAPMNAYGMALTRIEARWVSWTLNVAGGVTWTEAIGIEHDGADAGDR